MRRPTPARRCYARCYWSIPGDWVPAEIDDQFLLGRDLLVAPIFADTEDHVTRRAYLPGDANWYDWWTGTLHDGRQWIETTAPPGRLPLFARAGTAIPLAEPRQSIGDGQGRRDAAAPVRPEGWGHWRQHRVGRRRTDGRRAGARRPESSLLPGGHPRGRSAVLRLSVCQPAQPCWTPPRQTSRWSRATACCQGRAHPGPA